MSSRAEFLKLQVASFVSQCGSHLLTIFLAGYVLVSSGSIVKSSLIFVLSYMPSVFVSAELGEWIDRKLSRWLLIRNEVISIGTSVLCGICIAFHVPLGVLCVVVAVRSLLLFIARTAGTKWVKHITPPALQDSRIKLFFLSFFLSTAIAGVLAGTLLTQPSIWLVILVDVGTYLLSLTIISFLENPKLVPVGLVSIERSAFLSKLISTGSEILRAPDLRRPFLAVCLSQALFQGAYSVLVSYLPVVKLGMGVSGVGVFQFAASLGITLGFLLVWIWPTLLFGQHRRVSMTAFTVTTVGVFALFLTATLGSLPLCLGAFVILHLAYESVWLSNQSLFFRQTPSNSVARFQFTLTSLASFLMAGSTLAYSFLIQTLGLEIGILSVALSVLGLWIFLSSSQGIARNESPSMGVAP